jgi:hypothetical protein
MFAYAPDTRIKHHPVRFGSSNGEWTAVTGVFQGTFTKPMPIGNGKFIPLVRSLICRSTAGHPL